jgi:hypothetical protein
MSGLNGTNGRMAEWQNGRMAEWQNGKMAEWQNGRMAGMAGMAGMAEWQKEWQSGRMAEMATYVLFMVHANDVYLFSTFACTYFVVLHMVQKLLGGRRTYPPF